MDNDISQLNRQVIVLPAEVFDALVEWLDQPDDPNDYPKLTALFQRPRAFTRDCE